MPAHTLTQIEPLLVMLKALNKQIKAADKRVEESTKADAVVQRASMQRAGRGAGGRHHLRRAARQLIALP